VFRLPSGRGAVGLGGLLLLLARTSPGQDVVPGRVDAEALRRHVFFLGSDSLQGRAVGTPGERAAARYIAEQLALDGVAPIAGDGTYEQPVPLHGSVPGEDSDLRLVSPCGDRPLRLGDDYLLFTAGHQALVPRPLPLVFVGYGIGAPEYDYNDYLGQDVDGKIVVFLSGEPLSDDAGFFQGRRRTVYSTPEAKQRLAISRGARGSILIPSATEPSWKDWRYWQHQFAFEHVTLEYAVPRHFSAVISRRAAASLLCGGGPDLAQVTVMEERHTLASFPLPSALSFVGAFEERDFLSSNLAGLVRGRDPKLADSYVLVAAHYDHLGVGPAEAGDAIYNGVVDNAIGVAGLLELARVIAARPRPPRRSILFLAVTGEEHGLLGSSYYVDHPLVPLHRTVAAVNIDGLAHFARFHDVIGVGGELSTLGATLERVARRLGLSVSSPPPQFAATDPYAFSDQAAFAEAGIPALLVNEGFDWEGYSHDQALARVVEWERSTYHSPRDDLHQPLDFEATREHVELLLSLVLELADEDEPPRWRPGSAYAAAQLRARAEGR